MSYDFGDDCMGNDNHPYNLAVTVTVPTALPVVVPVESFQVKVAENVADFRRIPNLQALAVLGP